MFIFKEFIIYLTNCNNKHGIWISLDFTDGDCGAPIWLEEIAENKVSRKIIVAVVAGNYKLREEKVTPSGEVKYDQIPQGQTKYAYLAQINKKIQKFVRHAISRALPGN